MIGYQETYFPMFDTRTEEGRRRYAEMEDIFSNSLGRYGVKPPQGYSSWVEYYGKNPDKVPVWKGPPSARPGGSNSTGSGSLGSYTDEFGRLISGNQNGFSSANPRGANPLFGFARLGT